MLRGLFTKFRAKICVVSDRNFRANFRFLHLLVPERQQRRPRRDDAAPECDHERGGERTIVTPHILPCNIGNPPE